MSAQVVLLIVIAAWVGIIGLGVLLGRLMVGTKADKMLWRR